MKDTVIKPPQISIPRIAALAGLSLITPAFAVVNIDYVTVGNAGNAADAATGSLYGAVAYAYQIAKNEITISQYAEFLNAVAKTDTYELYSNGLSPVGGYPFIAGITQTGVVGGYEYAVAEGSGNKPITFVSWFKAARFINWMHNGQPTGDQDASTTEDGAYTLNGLNGQGGSGSAAKNVGATVWIPTEDEWYKAAYYDPNKGGVGIGGYWLHANQSDTMTSHTVGDVGAANFYDGIGFPATALTDGGAYGATSQSAYGTNDQAGNVYEWTDSAFNPQNNTLVLRGGAFSTDASFLPSSVRGAGGHPEYVNYDIGFRLASAVPEPTSLVLTLLASGTILLHRKRG
jgi:formylglycine-generating enzyme required for sulfatase activity